MVDFENPSTFIGILVIFLVVGILGLMVCDAIISSTESTSLETATMVIQVFQAGVLLCKLVVAVSGVGIIYKLLQQSGMIPKVGTGGSRPPG